MPPRQRNTQPSSPAVAAAAAAAAAPGLCDLPDELLLRVLERLHMADRFRCIAPVSRRLRALCLAPQLLRSVDFRASSYDELLIERLQSLLLFLQRHGAHVRNLWISEETTLGSDCSHVLSACLGVASTMPHLEQLTLVPVFDCGRLLGGMTGLRGLYLERAAGATDLHLGQLSRLAALRELHLSGTLLCPGPAAKPCLPPGLEALCIEGDLDVEVERELPPQLLLGLTNLQQLKLLDSRYSSASLAPFSALSALSRLDLVACDFLPAPTSLSTLSNLCQLQVASAVESMAPVEGMLAALPGLTTLALRLGFPSEDNEAPPVLHLPRSVTVLHHLRRLSFSTYRAGSLDASFPAGPWLAQLRWLGLPWQVAVPAAASLAAATQLQHLCLYALYPYHLLTYAIVPNERWAAFWRMVRDHAPLQSFCYEVDWGVAPVASAFVDGLLELSRSRPELRIARLQQELSDDDGKPDTSPFWAAMLGAEPAA